MTQQPLNQGLLQPRPPWTPERFADRLAEYVKSFTRITFWALVALVTGGLAYIAIQLVLWGVRLVLGILGV